MIGTDQKIEETNVGIHKQMNTKQVRTCLYVLTSCMDKLTPQEDELTKTSWKMV